MSVKVTRTITVTIEFKGDSITLDEKGAREKIAEWQGTIKKYQAIISEYQDIIEKMEREMQKALGLEPKSRQPLSEGRYQASLKTAARALEFLKEKSGTWLTVKDVASALHKSLNVTSQALRYLTDTKQACRIRQGPGFIYKYKPPTPDAPDKLPPIEQAIATDDLTGLRLEAQKRASLLRDR